MEGKPRTLRLRDVFAVLGIGVLCFPIMVLLLPNFEQARSEARISMAYHDVRRLSRPAAGQSSPSNETPEMDPWGKPYQMSLLGDDRFRVSSSGPNMISPDTGFDEDDIFSDMPTSPLTPFRIQKKRQFLIAIGSMLATWTLLLILYLRSRGTES